MSTDALTATVMRHLGVSTARLQAAVRQVPGLDEELVAGHTRLWTPAHVRKAEVAMRFTQASPRRHRGGDSVTLRTAFRAVFGNPEDPGDDEFAVWECGLGVPQRGELAVVEYVNREDPIRKVGDLRGVLVVSCEGLWPIEGVSMAEARRAPAKPEEPRHDAVPIIGERFVTPIDTGVPDE